MPATTTGRNAFTTGKAIVHITAVLTAGIASILAVLAAGAAILFGAGMGGLLLIIEVSDPGSGVAAFNNMPWITQKWVIIASFLGFALACLPTDTHY